MKFLGKKIMVGIEGEIILDLISVRGYCGVRFARVTDILSLALLASVLLANQCWPGEREF